MKTLKPLTHYESPQELLRETMQANGIDAEELAIRGCLPISRTLQVVEGVAPITDDIALGLQLATGIDSECWTMLELWYEAKMRPQRCHEVSA